jgi:hypothetical protein
VSTLEPRGPRNGDSVPGSELPGLAKLVAVSGLRVGAWAAVTGINAGRRAVDVVRHPERAADLAEDLREAASAITRALVGDEVEDRMRAAASGNALVRAVTDAVDSVTPHPHPHSHPHSDEPVPAEDPLHAAAQDLLRRSRDVWSDDRGHPAYSRIIQELAPDEGRILMLLLRKGPQATVDVRAGGLVGTSGSTLVKANLNMIGALAGCRHVERVQSYLHNLERLGLIWFSSEIVRDPMEYQVLEAQPDVLDARHGLRRPRVVRRSIHLTPFGEDFCRDGLGLPGSLAELEQPPPPHRRPSDG